MRSRCRRSGATISSGASRTAPVKCRRCRASRRSSCCVPTDERDVVPRLHALAVARRLRQLGEQPGVPARAQGAQHAGSGEHGQRAVVVRRRAARRARCNGEPPHVTATDPVLAAHRARRAVRDRRRGRPRRPDPGLQAAHASLRELMDAERSRAPTSTWLVQGDRRYTFGEHDRARARRSRRS